GATSGRAGGAAGPVAVVGQERAFLHAADDRIRSFVVVHVAHSEGYGGGSRRVDHLGAEGAVPVTEEHAQHAAVLVQDHQVHRTVTVHVQQLRGSVATRRGVDDGRT